MIGNVSGMKTTHHIFLALAFFTTMVANGQFLQIKGKIINYEEEFIPAHFALFRNDSLVQSGRSDALSFKLDLNQNYRLQVYRTGYQTKAIDFTTSTPVDKKFKFEFSVVLQKLPGYRESEDVKASGHVFYDDKKERFNYRIY